VIRLTDTRIRTKSQVESLDKLRRLDVLKSSREASFKDLLVSSGSLRPENLNGNFTENGYDPRSLDDPELRTGKRRTVLSLPSMMSSTIQFSKASDLKRELNEQFHQTHPQLDRSMTLSKIRSLKARLLEIGITLVSFIIMIIIVMMINND
jgi:hypothetical protein